MMQRYSKLLTGPIQRTQSGEHPQHLFFLFHGWGADGANLLDIASAFSHDFLGGEFHMPNAPYRCDTHKNSYQWFDLFNTSHKELLKGVEDAAKIVEYYIRKKTNQADLTYKDITLIGFSQGAMLAQHLALTRKNLCASVVAYSGKFIDLPEKNIQEKVPILLIHGEEDQVIPVDAMVNSYTTLKKYGIPVDAYRMMHLGHSINQAGLDIGQKFIKEHFIMGE